MNEVNAITERIIQAVIKVHSTLGPGFLERVYHNALLIELEQDGFKIDSEKEILIRYKEQLVGRHRLDLVVAGQVVLELKTVEDLSRAHYAQMRSYLKASGLPVGLLINFAPEKADFRRVECSEAKQLSP